MGGSSMVSERWPGRGLKGCVSPMGSRIEYVVVGSVRLS